MTCGTMIFQMLLCLEISVMYECVLVGMWCDVVVLCLVFVELWAQVLGYLSTVV